MTITNLPLEDLIQWLQGAAPLVTPQDRQPRPIDRVHPDTGHHSEFEISVDRLTFQHWGVKTAQQMAQSPFPILRPVSQILATAASIWPEDALLPYDTFVQSLSLALDALIARQETSADTDAMVMGLTAIVHALQQDEPKTWPGVWSHMAEAARATQLRLAEVSPAVMRLCTALDTLATVSREMAGRGPTPTEWDTLVVKGHEPFYKGRPFTNLDNAATTPPMQCVMDSMNRLASLYSSVHRGSGIRSLVTTEVYEEVRAQVKQFVGADPDYHEVIFVRNTTEALNVLAHLVSQQPDRHIITTAAEHHSNLLPWRRRDNVTVVPIDPMGQPLMAELERALQKNRAHDVLVAMSGASNVTGHVMNLFELSRLTHRYGGQLAVDAAQLAPHRPIRMAHQGEVFLDYLALSGHKLYAPFGAGALIAPKEQLMKLDPLLIGGGSADLVTASEIFMSRHQSRHEAGSPNVFGVVALNASIKAIQDIGWTAIINHEHALMRALSTGLQAIPGVTLFGNPEADRVGVVPFQVNALPSDQVAAILAGEWNIAVRYGCFCAHPLVIHLLGMSDEEAKATAKRGFSGAHFPGLLRASLGIYNTVEDVNILLEAVAAIANGDWDHAAYHPTLGGDVVHRDLQETVKAMVRQLL